MIVKKHSDWKKYEMFVVKKHQQRTGEITVHWDEIGDDILIDSGWALYPDLLQRMRLRNKKGLIREYGIDAISYYFKDGKKVFNPIQVKVRNGKQYLGARQLLGTYLSCYYQRFHPKHPDSRGFV